MDVGLLRVRLDGLTSPPLSEPTPLAAAGAGRVKPGEAQQFLLSGLTTPIEPTGQQAELDEMKEKMKDLELEMAAQKALSHNRTPVDLGQVFEKQNQLLELALDKPIGGKSRSSTIKVEPRVQWPKLGDDGPGGKEVEEFYEAFEDICGLANNGTGMPDKEMLVALKSCLSGSRKTIYENVVRAMKTQMCTDDGPGEVYRTIKKRLLRFLEPPTEKQLRVKTEWVNLTKT